MISLTRHSGGECVFFCEEVGECVFFCEEVGECVFFCEEVGEDMMQLVMSSTSGWRAYMYFPIGPVELGRRFLPSVCV